ncbi:hypothetical protein E2C01_046250 [Portunus trituberculatus]|uniref:Uncharacterized protein n=1 Tax=Portunus trituberculatus TaxID=210409 RepID=A0A5B7G0G2_PORTR|nr:hypothetical protein [Portunus trituberculatus]
MIVSCVGNTLTTNYTVWAGQTQYEPHHCPEWLIRSQEKVSDFKNVTKRDENARNSHITSSHQ